MASISTHNQESLLIADAFQCTGSETSTMATRSVSAQSAHVINIAQVPHRSPFRYPGGKTWLIPKIRQWLTSLHPRPRELAEPFAGGATVGLSALFEQLVEKIVLIEKDEDVAAVWEVLVYGEAQRLANSIVQFEFSHKSVTSILANESTTTFDRAFATIIRNRVQRGGILAPGASLIKKGENGRGLASRWYPETLKKRIEAILHMRHSMAFVFADGIEFIRYNACRPDSVFFIDPPYTVAGKRLYKHSELNHRKLFEAVAEIRGDFLMTYDNSREIRNLAVEFDFKTKLVPMKNTHHEIMNELLIGRDLTWIAS